MKLSLVERETILLYNQAEPMAEIYTHDPGLTDLFTRQFRKVAQEQQKSSVLQKLKQELPAHKSAAPKKREPER